MNKIHPSTYIVAGIFFILYLILTPVRGHVYDMGCWKVWLEHIYAKGLGHSYEGVINYLPLHLYEFKIVTLLFHSREYAYDHIHFFKYFTLIFDFASALLLASFSSRKNVQIGLFLALILNISYLHNTIFWGQFDTVFSFFVFASVVAAVRNRLLGSAVLFLISLNFKFQAILFFPLLFLIFIYQMPLKMDWKKIIYGALIVIFTQVIIIIPWILSGTSSAFINVLKGLFGLYTYVSLYAGNVWYLMLPGELRWTADNNSWHGLTFKLWGLIMLSVFLLITLIPLISSVWTKWKNKSAQLPVESVFAIGALSVMAFFFFNTQMHERYTFPAFLFIAAYCYYTRYWWIYVLFSIAYFLNNEKMLDFFHLNTKSSWFDMPTIAKIYLLVILSLLIPLFLRFKKENVEKI